MGQLYVGGLSSGRFSKIEISELCQKFDKVAAMVVATSHRSTKI